MTQQQYTIKLRTDSIPYSLCTPRHVPIPLLDKVKAERKKMENTGVISIVEDPTEWCSGMVLVPTKNGSVPICVDYINKAVCREKFILPSVKHTIGSLAGAKVFSNLDANREFWQIPLSPESSRYTTFITPFGHFYFLRAALWQSVNSGTFPATYVRDHIWFAGSGPYLGKRPTRA